MSGRRWPGRTVRLRFTLLYAAVFLLSGCALLVLTNVLASVSNTQPAPGQFPPAQQADPAVAQQHIRELQTRLDELQTMQSRRLLVGSVVALVVMGLVSLLLGRLISGRVLRPLRTITAATRRISAENLHERLAVAGPQDEVKDLADTVDGLLARLEASFAAQRRFVANASHELRTPLATMRASLDVALAKPEPVPAQTVALAGRVRVELDRVDRLLDGFLMLARAQHGALADRAPIALGRLVEQALASRADIDARGLAVDTTGVADDVVAEGSATLLARLVQNLVDNAVVHNEDGGWLRIAAAAADGTVELVVESGGPVLEQAQVDRLASPFQRLGADRVGSDDGSGLGLSIVAAVAEAHGGRLDLRARPAGGLRAAVSLPQAREAVA
ncbi:HAMP domain-containing sensor histidine kinase [Catellatospora citrea]|nr:ATP-binding protein [Catellatospora citrea]RKE06057.1 hypothetical protein C8E86_0875 [Catellatospora citrea]